MSVVCNAVVRSASMSAIGVSDLLRGSAYPASGLGVFVIEVQQTQVTGEQDAQAFCILLDPAAVLHAVPQLEQDDG